MRSRFPTKVIAWPAVAEDNLLLGRTVIGDAGNPLRIMRSAWRRSAERVGSSVLEIEILCSDSHEHRRRIERRIVDIPVTWNEVGAEL
jgi:predicted kinase